MSSRKPDAEQPRPASTSAIPEIIEPRPSSDQSSDKSSDFDFDQACGSSTRSVSTSVYKYHKENGRTYHGYRAGSYHFPNDATEIDRLEHHYILLNHCLGDRLFLAPLPPPSSLQPPFHILDIGTGTGTWAVEMGDLFPLASIEATDLSPIQPSAVPSNVQFLIDDAENPDWAVPFDHYDYIHARDLLGAFASMPEVIAHAFRHTRPGGYMESQEILAVPQCADGSMPATWPFLVWSELLAKTSAEAGRDLDVARSVRGWYEDAGFVDVREEVFRAPIGRWPKEARQRELGHWWRENLVVGLQGFSLAYLSRGLGWSKEEIEVYLVDVRRSLGERGVHAFHEVYVVWGRKPEVGEVRGKGEGK